MNRPCLFRVRLVLTATRDVSLHAHHAATLYALLAAAYGRGTASESGVPDQVWLDAPEQARLIVRAGSDYAFGLTLCTSTVADAQTKLRDVCVGLRELGTHTPPGKPKWGGNFRVRHVEDLVTGTPWNERTPLTPLPPIWEREIAQLARADTLTLRFTSPLRAERGDHERRTGHEYFDRDLFNPSTFLYRLVNRLVALGFLPSELRNPPRDPDIRVIDNRLVWLDLSYGPAQRRKGTGGACGVVRLGGLSPLARSALVLGQYVRVGGGTKFGFGAYRIDELGPASFVCQRAEPLLANAKLPRNVWANEYIPPEPTRLTIPKANGESRRLAIPKPADRALQRAVVDVIAPALDVFLEESSLAYRAGLGRERAAQRVRHSVRDGFAFAVKSDFRHFFDEVDHVELEERLRVYLADEQAVRLIMAWVRSAAPTPTRGLPTGSPLAPVLANVLLDQFDERIAAEGGRLVRYADDFLILTRTRAEAERLFRSAQAEAEQLQLTLNTAKSALLELHEPFHFLGFRFAPQAGDWQMENTAGEPLVLADIGWEDAKERPTPNAPRLPGESAEPGADPQGCWVIGPDLETVLFQDGHLVPITPGANEVEGIPISALEELVILGSPPLGEGVLAALAERQTVVMLTDPHGRDGGSFLPDNAVEDPTAIAAQAVACQHEPTRVNVAKTLIAAKLRNYAALAECFPGTASPTIPQELRTLADRLASATTLETIRGLEGAGAARWYGSLNARLPPGFRFSKRVAPDAADPVNVLLNIAHTYLYRLAALACRTAGLAPRLGFLHESRAGFLALAADLQEPFRHLMDRVVLDSLQWLRPMDFNRTPDGPYALMIRPGAARDFQAALARQLILPWLPHKAREPRPYRVHLVALAKNLKRALLDPTRVFLAPEHPPRSSA